MKIKRIEHIAIAVKSMAQSREIFETKLGFSLEYEEYLPQYNTRLGDVSGRADLYRTLGV